MNKFFRRGFSNLIITALLFLVSSCGGSSESTFVILSTNDMHSQIDKYPALASAIKECRDTVDVILVDAGDRCTGNAFVDLVDHYTPLYDMMNTVGYDVVTYGNHEFDKGQSELAVANRQAKFPIISANIISDTTSFPQPAPHIILERGGKKIAFVGIVGNYDANNHPAGKDESFAGLTFTDPHASAAQYTSLADECDMVVLLSHCGLERDVEFAQSNSSKGFDLIVSAHSHDTATQKEGDIFITQTGSRLKNIGATTVTITASGEVKLSHRNIPLSDYTPDSAMAEMVDKYHNNPLLTKTIGRAATTFETIGVRNLFAETLRKATKANIGLYHAGGVRVPQIPQGDIDMALVLNAEPFNSYIATVTMNTAQLKKLIMTKFNDKVNVGESKYLDIVTTVPYTILTDPASGDAVDVLFPTLSEKRSYRVALGDYIFKTYRGLSYSKGEITDILVTSALEQVIKENAEITPHNENLQQIVVTTPQEETEE